LTTPRAPYEEVLTELQGLTKSKLKSLLGVSDGLATLNYNRYKGFKAQPSKPAMWMYTGAVFQAMKPHGFDEAQEEYAQKHVRILSGLYGLLRPKDVIQPYRIDMGKKLSVGSCKNL